MLARHGDDVVNGPVEGLTPDELTNQFDVNVIGLFTTPGTGAYNSSKYAIESLADALRMELRPWKIPVSLIEPGLIRTDIWGDILDEHDRMVDHLKEEHRRLYAPQLAGTRKLLGRMQKIAADPGKVTEAVDHALTAKRPKTRYLLDFSSRAQKALVAITPTAITDAVLTKATTSK